MWPSLSDYLGHLRYYLFISYPVQFLRMLKAFCWEETSKNHILNYRVAHEGFPQCPVSLAGRGTTLRNPCGLLESPDKSTKVVDGGWWKFDPSSVWDVFFCREVLSRFFVSSFRNSFCWEVGPLGCVTDLTWSHMDHGASHILLDSSCPIPKKCPNTSRTYQRSEAAPLHTICWRALRPLRGEVKDGQSMSMFNTWDYTSSLWWFVTGFATLRA